MNNLSKLSELIEISENDNMDVSIYCPTLSLLACNRDVDILPDLESVLLESVSDKDFPKILNSIHSHLIKTYQISEFKVERRKVSQRKREGKTDPQKSRLAKMVWKKNKSKITQGLKKFHKSAKGKAFHKALSKFVGSRTQKRESVENLELEEVKLGLNELRISLSSAITQLLIEMKSNPDSYLDFPQEDFNELIDAYGEAMKDLQDAYVSEDIIQMEDTMDEIIAEFASVLVGIDMEFVYYDSPHTTPA